MTRVDATTTIPVEVASWVTKFVGGDGSGPRAFAEPITPGEKLGDLLQRYSRRFPELDAALWDATRTALAEHIEVLVNDAVLGIAHSLDSPLKPGDRITLLAQFMGGA